MNTVASLCASLVIGLTLCPDALAGDQSAAYTPPCCAAALHNTLTPAEAARGFHLLFDGKSTQAWRGYKQEAFPERVVVLEAILHPRLPSVPSPPRLRASPRAKVGVAAALRTANLGGAPPLSRRADGGLRTGRVQSSPAGGRASSSTRGGASVPLKSSSRRACRRSARDSACSLRWR